MSKRLRWLIPLIAVAVTAVLLVSLDRRRVTHSSPRNDAAVERPTGARPPAKAEPVAPPVSPVWFEIADVGIDFEYFNSDDPATPGARMFEFTGGGVGVIDYDADGRADLHFTQGCAWPPDPSQREHLDRLYRNFGKHYVDVTAAAGIMEPGFSQGVACGDFDGDGFADLYVANIGANHLFRNNGDGTFRDVSQEAGIADDAWTTSVAIADLNSDGHPELFDVNYVEGRDVFERICDHDGIPRVCSPTAFDAEDDRLWLNRGDGTFTDVSAIAGIDAADGTGLGVAVADFDGSGRLSLFVANDARKNHFYADASAGRGSLPRFVERGQVNGTAVDYEGRAQACMGIAVGDANRDARQDLFVTNYVEEANTLYVQTEDGLFRDLSRQTGLAKPSIPMLGFGTQFLDGDLDGWEDLIVANGHVDDFTHRGYEYPMRPQFFRNVGGRFVELPSETLGPYFMEKRLGRGLARLDWNRDGREDFAVSHLNGRSLLLTNATAPAGQALGIRLVATNTARDAVGTTVVVEADGQRIVRQLTAGDGYQASNEKTLVFGLGDQHVVERLSIRWPSGERSQFDGVATGAAWLIVEGHARPLRLTTYPARWHATN